MPRSIEALVTPELLRWSRKTAGFDIDVAAKKIGCTADRLKDWEAGHSHPTIAQARKAATAYKRPLAVFFLASPPRGFTVLRDFRRLPQGAPSKFSPQLLYLIRRVHDRQEWAAGVRVEQGRRPLGFVGSVTPHMDPVEVARRARKQLGVSLSDQQSWRRNDHALRQWIDACGIAGNFVFQSSRVPLDEMRGFAIPHRMAPCILVNSKDSPAGRIFTLMHEFTHILLNLGGVSNRDISPRPKSDEQRIEVFCNAVAAETLVPRAALSSDLGRVGQEDPDLAIQRCARMYSVSSEVIARRMCDLGYLTKEEYRERRALYLQEAETQPDRRGKEVRIPYATVVVRDNGRPFTREVLAAYGDGIVDARDVAALLDVKLKHLDRIEMAVFPTRWKGVAVT